MFEIASHSPPSGPGNDTGSIRFAYESGHVKGGWQGGRGWHKNSPNISDAAKPNYLQAGKWMIEGVYEALDHPNEYYFDDQKKLLYVIPNTTSTSSSTGTDGPPTSELVAVKLKTLFSLMGTVGAVNAEADTAAGTRVRMEPKTVVKDITFRGIGFRDATDVSMEPWGVPSGGDWGKCVECA